MYRVNFGGCQVSHRFPTKRAALAYIAECKAYGGDPRYHAGTAVDPGEWFRCR